MSRELPVRENVAKVVRFNEIDNIVKILSTNGNIKGDPETKLAPLNETIKFFHSIFTEHRIPNIKVPIVAPKVCRFYDIRLRLLLIYLFTLEVPSISSNTFHNESSTRFLRRLYESFMRRKNIPKVSLQNVPEQLIRNFSFP